MEHGSDFFTAAAGHSPRREDYPVYRAPDDENFRGIHAVDVLTGIDDLTLDGLIEIAYDPFLPAFARLGPALVAAHEALPEKARAEAVELIDAWDHRVAEDSVAMTLMHFYATNLNAMVGFPDELANASRMERLEYAGIAAPPDERLAVFDATLAMLEDDFGDWRQPWADVNRFQRLTGDIDHPFDDAGPSLGVGLASARWGALAAYGSKRFGDTKKLYGYRGNSFVAVVEFGEKVRAKSLLAGGQSGDPASPHFDDQAERYVNGDFKDVPYYRDDVEARATRTYKPGL